MIIISVIIAIFLNGLIGWQLLRLLQIQINPVMRLAASYLVGQLLSSLFYFLWLLLFPHLAFGWIIFELVCTTALFVMNFKLDHQSKFVQNNDSSPINQSYKHQFLGWFLASCIGIIAIYMACVHSWLGSFTPYGMWDAASMWSFRIPYLLQHIDQWQDIFLNTTAHPDYPLLHSISIARLCAIQGSYVPAVAQWYGYFNAALILIMIYSTLSNHAGKWQAFLASLILFSSEYWWGLTTWQYADHTLCSYLTLSAILCYLWLKNLHASTQCHSCPLLILLALTTAACAWTKNEGWPWVLIMSLMVLSVSIKTSSKQFLKTSTIWFASLFLILWMPITVHFLAEGSNDLISSTHWTQTTNRLFDLSRTSLIFSKLLDIFVTLYPYKILALSFIWILGYKPWQALPRKKPALAILLLLSLQFLSYILVYQITPHDLNWHIGAAANRLMLQVWPLLLLGMFLMASKPCVPPNDSLLNDDAKHPII